MKANKVTVTITVEVLDIDSVYNMGIKCLEQIVDQAPNGKLVQVDGDTVTWETTMKPVEI